MTENICNIAENVNRLKFEVNELCAKLGKDADTIQIMGVSKTKTAQDVEKAIKAGITLFGENRVQELQQKAYRLQDRQ